MRDLRRVHDTWDEWGHVDPLYGVLSRPSARGGHWDEAEFYASGRAHMDDLVAELNERCLLPVRRRALDFGCGVGRLTQALAPHFDEVHGVDISESMIERARAAADPDAGVVFHANVRADLSSFDDGTFDLAVSFLVLQHMPSELALSYVREMVRILAPGGIAVIQAPERYLRPTRLADSRWLPPRVRNRCVRLKAALLRRPYMEMHVLRCQHVIDSVVAAGGEVLEAAPDWSGGEFCLSMRYVVRKMSELAEPSTAR